MRWLARWGMTALLLSGCVRDPCDARVDTDRCEDEVRWHCPARGVDQWVSSSWVKEDCAAAEGVCRLTGEGAAFCARSELPHPACAGEVLRACESETRALSCRDGLVVDSEDCLRCMPATEEDPVVRCHGGRGTRCSSDSDCLPSLSCPPDRGFCLPGPPPS